MPRKKSYITATDQFCGAGGSTTGAKLAGVEVKMALNHWNLAIETHNTNHPEVDHDCTDIQACDPRRYPSTDVLFTSPECTNHSLAKGLKKKYQNQMKIFGEVILDPSHERSRATMWDVPRFAEYHDYNSIVVENVVDARYWTLWNAWLKAMHDLGYNHKCLYLNSMFFHPCPQSRDRLYVVFWKKGNREPDLDFRPTAHCQNCGEDKESWQSWKRREKQWGKYRQQYIYRCSECNEEVTPYYYAAFNVIDWATPGRKIGDRKKPLSPKTLERIQYGLDKFAHQPFLVQSRHRSGLRSRVRNLATDPAYTHTTQTDHGVVMPFMVRSAHTKTRNNLHVRDIHEVIWTQTTSDNVGVVFPFIIEMNRTGKARSTNEFISTVLAGGNHHGLVMQPLFLQNKGQSKAKRITDPFNTVTAIPSLGIVTDESFQAFLTYYNGQNGASQITDPVNTITTVERANLVQAKSPDIDDCYYRMLKWYETRKAMAFNDDYVILGNSKDKIRQLGNAVTPPVMQWITNQVIESFN